MSGGIILDRDNSWICAGWAAANAVREILQHLDGPARDDVGQRLAAVDLYPGSLADFRNAPAADVQALYEAAVRARAAVGERGPAGWHSPEFFPGYVARLEELVELLAQDPRVRDGGG